MPGETRIAALGGSARRPGGQQPRRAGACSGHRGSHALQCCCDRGTGRGPASSLLALLLPLFLALAAPAAATETVSAPDVVFEDVVLQGDLANDQATFTLKAVADVKTRDAAAMLLSGRVALLEPARDRKWEVAFEQDRFVFHAARPGKYPIQVRFAAGVHTTNNWNDVAFTAPPGPLRKIAVRGLAVDTQFRFADGARMDREGDEFVSYLPTSGTVQLAWKEAKAETEGKLFYSAEAFSQVTISPGLMRQTTLLDFRVMQGELTRVVVALRGEGEVTRVQGDQILSWNVEKVAGGSHRRLVVQFNQPRRESFVFWVQTETPLGAFPQAVSAMHWQPEGTTRFGGYFRIANAGAVRLEVVQASGLSQISPEQLPQTEVTKQLFGAQASQTFAYRFSGGEFQLRVQADNILPELTVSQVLTYHLGETELDIEAEIELDIREAPLRELELRVPGGYALARLNASGLSDYFVTDGADPNVAQLRIVYGTPATGRQVIQLRLERNQPLAEASWSLPRLEVVRAKSVRGHVGVTADAGYRLTPASTQGLTDIATAFFPKKTAGVQAAFRLNDPGWQASIQVERLAQSLQADAFHLFSVGEGIAYGSSLINYVIAGAPVSAFRVELSAEYFNVEFVGKDVRNWQKSDGGYVVQLHTPVSGPYNLLATYERPFKAQGETLSFTGARAVDAQTEQGHTLVISAYPFQVRAVDVSTNLLPLEPGEVPPEHRLFFDAAILAAYRYSARPFNLQLEMKPLAQGETVNQVVDRASLLTRISQEGQVLTEARYFVKSKGTPYFRVTLPDGMELWTAVVNGSAAVPVKDGTAKLIPLPQGKDPNAVNTVELKLAARAKNPSHLALGVPQVAAPILLAEWRLEPDANRRLTFEKGTLSPVIATTPDISGFAEVARLLWPGSGREELGRFGEGLGLLLVGLVLWRWAAQGAVSRFSARHVAGSLVGLVAVVLALVCFGQVADAGRSTAVVQPPDLQFLIPVQPAGNTLAVEVGNVEREVGWWVRVRLAWPALVGVIVWAYALVATDGLLRRLLGLAGWVLVFWAALRWPNGATAFFVLWMVFVLVQLIVPSLRALWSVPPRPVENGGPGAATATAALAAACLLACGTESQAQETAAQPAGAQQVAAAPIPAVDLTVTNVLAMADLVTQTVRVEEEYATVEAEIVWHARKGELLPLLGDPAVLTDIDYPETRFELRTVDEAGRRAYRLFARKDGEVRIHLRYQLRLPKKEAANGLRLAVAPGLVNRVHLTVVGQDVDLQVPSAISIQREDTTTSTNTVAQLTLAPGQSPQLAWRPRSRDTRKEKAVFYGELFQLYVPAAGVIEGVHQAVVRPAQGELSEVVFDVPAGATITDVTAPGLSLWRFDPDERKLRVTFSPTQPRAVAIVVRSQVATGPLPFEQRVGLIALHDAAGQVGLMGVATGSEVQLEDVQTEEFAAINLEDFPVQLLQSLQQQVAGLALRRAYRYADFKGGALLKAAAVEPDVRVETQETLSLGEDRIVLAANLAVEITRAGIFKLSFVLPAGLDVESITGPAMSHWTELKTDEGRVITLHLKGKTEGKQPFAISLAGAGVKPAEAWAVPHLRLREAGKQRGQIVIVPEQGMRLQPGTREGVTQLDPLKAGIRQKGVLVFRLLNEQWQLGLGIEQVDAWIQVSSLQDVTVSEAQVKVTANLNYQIENTGVKALRVRLPANAESVRFRGEQLSDFKRLEAAENRDWEIKLHRRVMGRYLLQASYVVPTPTSASELTLGGVQALDVNLQRGFLTLHSGNRLQVRVGATPDSLQPAEWQNIPRQLQQDLDLASASETFRLVEADFQLPLRLERHEVAQLLPARVRNVTFTSVISDDGAMLTQARLEMVPGDKRLLSLTLPGDARFWFAFVNDNSVWPWREGNRILIPLDQPSRADAATSVEFFYATPTAKASRSSLSLDLLGPQFELPLENITWHVYLNGRWHVEDTTGSLQLREHTATPQSATIDLRQYIETETSWQKGKIREAEQLLSFGNQLLEKGDPQQARRAFQAAYGLSQNDMAFNEDARVQLHNLKTQQALIGLNTRQAAVAGETDALASRLLGAKNVENRYTQQEAKQMLERYTAEDNAGQMKLAERIVQQQDAALANPAAIRASIPQQGQLLTFTRSLQVDTWSDLKIGITASAARTTSLWLRIGILAAVLIVLGVLSSIAVRKTA